MLVFQGLRKDRPSPLINDWPEEFHTKVEQVSQFDRHFFIHSHHCFPEHNTDSEPLFLLLPDFIEGRAPSFLLGLSVPCWLYFSRLLVFFTDPWSGAPLIGFSNFEKLWVSSLYFRKTYIFVWICPFIPNPECQQLFFFFNQEKVYSSLPDMKLQSYLKIFALLDNRFYGLSVVRECSESCRQSVK